MRKNTVINLILIVMISSLFCLLLFLFKLIANTQDLNLVLISIDTLRADHMGIYGYKRNTTPNIDKLAQDATTFTNVYTLMPSTIHSFYTLFTGRDDIVSQKEMRTGPTDIDHLINKVSTLTQLLNKNNYNTAAVITNPTLGLINSFFRDDFNQFSYIDSSIYSKDWGWNDAFKVDYENSKKINSKVLKWLEEKKKSKFFLWLHYSNPHFPYTPLQEDLCKIDGNCNSPKYKLPIEDILTKKKNCNNIIKKEDDDNYYPSLINLYDAEILSTDKQIGKIIEKLKQLNLYNNTLIVLYGDHGEEFNHRIFNHIHTLYQSTVHIPLIIRDPHYLNARKISQFMDNTDILPTLLDLLNIAYNKKQFTGNSLSNAFSSRTFSWAKQQVFFITPTNVSNKFGVFDGRYKYIFSNSDRCLYNNYKEELYDVSNDQEEENNIINQNPIIAKTLKEKLFKKIKI